MQQEFELCKILIEQHHRFVLTTHINPDGDGLGSELALTSLLRSRGKTVHMLNHSETPYYYGFLDPNGQIQQFDEQRHSALVHEAGVIFVLDTNQPERLGTLKPFVLESRAKKICIDHHLDRTEFADVYILDEDSAATSEIMYHLLEYLDGNRFTPEVATALYTGIMTDTGSFRFPRTSADLHRRVAHLIECGADPVTIYQNVYEQGTLGRLQLLGKVLSTLQTAHDGKVASLQATREMFRETETREEDTDGMINYTLSIKGVQVGLMFTELQDNVKVGFRSKGDIAVNKLAQEFGGNGHMNAAGARVTGAKVHKLAAKIIARSKVYIR